MKPLRFNAASSRMSAPSSAYPYDALTGGSAIKSSQPDQLQYRDLKNQMRGNMMNFNEVIDYLDNKNLPPQLRQTPWVKILANDTDIQLLIPANPNRMSFVIAYIDSDLEAGSFVYFSYGQPPFPQFGIPLLSTVPYAEGNGTISIDDIYISGAGTLGSDTNYPVRVLGYEGVLAVESHLHRNTNVPAG